MLSEALLAHVRRIVDEAPPLTPAQRDQLAAILANAYAAEMPRAS